MTSIPRPPPGRFVVLLAASLLVLAFAAHSAQAACAPTGDWKKVLFAKPRVHPILQAAGVDAATLMVNVQTAFDLERERRWVEARLDPVSFLLCDEETQMTPAAWLPRVDDLHQRRVVLEIDPNLGLDREGASEALLRYGLVAVGVDFKAGLSDTPGIFSVRMRLPRADAFVEAFVRPREIDAYVAIGLGVLYRDEGDHDLAFSNFCRGLELMENLPSPGLPPLRPPQLEAQERLEAFGRAHLNETIEDGLDKPSGALITHLRDRDPAGFAAAPCRADAQNG